MASHQEPQKSTADLGRGGDSKKQGLEDNKPQRMPAGDPSWVSQLLACMWPNISEAMEKVAKEMLPDMLQQNKPTWMTKLGLDTFELGSKAPTIEHVRVVEGEKPGVNDSALEFDFTWHGDQNILLDVNPAPAFVGKVPLLGNVLDKALTWKMGVKDMVIRGRLRTSFCPLLKALPIVGAVQAAFVGLPKLDFSLDLPDGLKAVVPVEWLDGWLDSFIADNILSMYMLPDHFFMQVDEKARDIQTPQGILEVEVLEATHVPSMDFVGKSDPFVKLWLRPPAAKQTPTKHGAEPKWAPGEATYALPVHLRNIQILTLTVFDADNVGADEIGRTRVQLEDLSPGQQHDLWLDINVPSHGNAASKEKTRKRDKVAGMLLGTKGAQAKDVEQCQVHVKLTFHPIDEETIKQLDKAQSEGKTPGADLNAMIKDPTLSQLISKHKLADELFPTRQDNSKQNTPQTPQR
ncbi:hypothetical protein WJX73_009259 [Symbiochloris irregularis]|uniref:Uncharacterized protein n=1 Tax=Symbiochloris irregularis TaxID=706552 RepID=A0AAW1PYE3_9CHLO